MLNCPSTGGLILSMNGEPLSTAFTESVSRDSETETPSVTSLAAALRLAGVMRLTVPNWSSLPQRPQFERSFIICSKSAFEICAGVGVWASAVRPEIRDQGGDNTELQIEMQTRFPPVYFRCLVFSPRAPLAHEASGYRGSTSAMSRGPRLNVSHDHLGLKVVKAVKVVNGSVGEEVNG